MLFRSALAGMAVITSAAEGQAAGRRLVEVERLAAVLVKGGHLPESGPQITDVLTALDQTRAFPHARLPGPGPRGTGCALATAIAIELGRGGELAAAIEAAIGWLAGAIAAASSVGGERRL